MLNFKENLRSLATPHAIGEPIGERGAKENLITRYLSQERGL
jgi:hypothetical protein